MSQITERALSDALKRLLQTKPLNKITVTQITDECGVSRMTFYYHFECMWDLFRSIPSIVNPGETIFSEYYKLNKEDPNFSLCRVTEKQGQDAHTNKKYGMNRVALDELMKLFMTTDEELADKTIDDVFDDRFYNTNFWIYWQTMFAFEKWHSAIEMKRYMQRYIHHIDGLPDLSALRFTRYNQYDSMIKPMVKYITDAGAKVEFGCRVTDIVCDCSGGKKVAKQLRYVQDGKPTTLHLTEDDLVFVTNGAQGDGSAYGDQTHAPVVDIKNGTGPSVELWKMLAAQDPSFGHPEKFFRSIKETSWESWTVDTANKEILEAIEKICHRDPLSGKVVTGGIVTAKDSSWLLSWTINRQGQFLDQPDDHCLIWVYGLNCWDDKGDYVKKPIYQCTGAELCAEWLYHIGIAPDHIDHLANQECNTTPCMMPYVTSFFEPRRPGDRPDVVPEGSVNLAFIGQYAETPRDTVFTTEYSIRTGMEAVYTLCHVDRGVPEVWGSVFDVRDLLRSVYMLTDGKKLTQMDLDMKQRVALQAALWRAPAGGRPAASPMRAQLVAHLGTAGGAAHNWWRTSGQPLATGGAHWDVPAGRPATGGAPRDSHRRLLVQFGTDSTTAGAAWDR